MIRWLPILLFAFACSGANLLPNSSFEAGTHRGWSYATAMDQRSGLAVAYTTAEHYDGATAIQLEHSNATNAQGWVSVPVRLQPSTAYTVSVYAKKAGGYSLDITIENTFGAAGPNDSATTNVETTTSWVRYALQHTTTATASMCTYRVRISPHEQSGPNMWTFIDAVQLEEGTSATTYAPSTALELGMSQSATVIGNTFLQGETAAIPYTLYNSTASASNVVICYTVTNGFNARVLSNVVAVTASAGATTGTINASPGQLGAFRLVAWIDGSTNLDEITYSMLPTPQTLGSAGYFGTHAKPYPFFLTQAARAGFTQNRTLSVLNWGRPSVAEPTDNAFVWFDEEVAHCLTNGLHPLIVLGGTYSTDIPAYMKGTGTNQFDMTAWRDFCTNVIAHYYALGVTNYEVGNEPFGESQWTNTWEYVRMMSNAFNIATNISADIRIIGGVDWYTNTLANVMQTEAGSNYCHIVSTHIYSPNDEVAVQQVQFGTTFNKSMWNSEQGLRTDTAYKTILAEDAYQTDMVPGERDPITKGSQWVYNVARTCVGPITKNFYYDGRSSGALDWLINFSMFEYDGSLRPKVAMAATLFKLIDGGAQGVSAMTNSTEAHVFKVGSQAVAVLWATNVAYLRTNAPVTGYATYDAFGNATTYPATLSASGYPVYAVGTTTTNALWSALNISQTAPITSTSGRLQGNGRVKLNGRIR